MEYEAKRNKAADQFTNYLFNISKKHIQWMQKLSEEDDEKLKEMISKGDEITRDHEAMTQ